jgi:hypothetical protein
MIHTTNDGMRSLFFQASLSTRYWVESLYTATYILNLLPTKAISAPTPYFTLFGTTPTYTHLQVFGCTCYPNTSATAPHKLAPCSCRCVFLVYSPYHKGYRYLDLTMNYLLISRHVIFDKSSFPFASFDPPPDDLDSPLLVQSYGLPDCSTLPLLYCRYFRAYHRATHGLGATSHATHGPGAARPTRGPDAPAHAMRGPTFSSMPCTSSASHFTESPWCTSDDI